jgi:hypothetical protein
MSIRANSSHSLSPVCDTSITSNRCITCLHGDEHGKEREPTRRARTARATSSSSRTACIACLVQMTRPSEFCKKRQDASRAIGEMQ